MEAWLWFMQEEGGWFVTYIALLGLVVGSFLNVVIYRLPIMMEQELKEQCDHLAGQVPEQLPRFDLLFPCSTCPHCGHKIRFWENIPVVSYLFLRGRCSSCHTPIGSRYPLTELFTGALSVIVALRFGIGWELVGALLFTWALIALSFIDLDHLLLPDAITQPFIWLGLIVASFGLFTDLESSVIGAVAGYLSLRIVYELFRKATGKDGMGFGDFKLLALIGAWLGWQHLPFVILTSSLIGAVVGLSLIIILRQDKNMPMPFGPYLAAAGWVAMMWGDDINRLYLHWAV